MFGFIEFGVLIVEKEALLISSSFPSVFDVPIKFIL